MILCLNDNILFKMVVMPLIETNAVRLHLLHQLELSLQPLLPSLLLFLHALLMLLNFFEVIF